MDIYLDPEEKIICPYNNSHHISRKTFNTHLVKCKKSYPNAKLVDCDFNVCHKIPEPELQYHHENCPDRKKIEIAVYQESNTDLNKYPIKNPDIPADECWDDYNVPTYDPKKNCENKEVIRYLAVESASKRRNFRMEERKRISQLTSIERPRNEPGPSTSREVNIPKVKVELPETQGRVIDEETPDFIGNLVNLLHTGANQPYISKK